MQQSAERESSEDIWYLIWSLGEPGIFTDGLI